MEYQVPFSTEAQRFAEHLEDAENKRVLFSAPFGAGKSYFLKGFFSSSQYLTITLQPTDYSVATNADVFELIKYDILSQIFEKFSPWLTLDESDFSDLLVAQSFVMNKLDFYSLAKSAIKCFVPKAESIESVTNQVEKLVADYSEYKKGLQSTDEESIIKYLVDIRMQKGSPRERDFFTLKIIEYLVRIKTAAKKEIVLIIDDVDRLDADQVFRVFNIFTAHHDSRIKNNKFSFDKVVFVCDINNVEHLFFHKYGSKAEFNGYIDKFYSQAIFFFDNKKYLKESIKTLVSQKESLGKYYSNNALSREYSITYSINNSDFYNVFEFIVGELIDANVIKMRNFVRFIEYTLPNLEIKNFAGRPVLSDNYGLIVLFHLLGQFFSRPTEFENALKHMSDNFIGDYQTDKPKYRGSDGIEHLIIQFALPFLIQEELVGDTHTNKRYSLITEEQKTVEIIYQYRYSIFNEGLTYVSCLKAGLLTVHENGEITGKVINRPNVYWILFNAFKECKLRRLSLRFFKL